MSHNNKNQYYGLSALLNVLEGTERIDHVKKYLPFNEDINRLNKKGKSLLIRTIEGIDDDNNVEIIELLLQNGANVDYPDKHGSTPLYHAILNIHNMHTIKVLLENGADPNALVKVSTKTFEVNTRSLFSFFLEQIEAKNLDDKDLIKIFVKFGAKIYGIPPIIPIQLVSLKHAQNIPQVVKLVDKFDLVNAGYFALVLKSCILNETDDCKILETLLQKFTYFIKDLGEHYFSGLIIPKKKNKSEIISKLIFLIENFGYNISNRISLTYHMINLCYKDNLVGVIKALLYLSNDINEKDEKGNGYMYNAINLYCSRCNRHLLRLLLNLNIDHNIRYLSSVYNIRDVLTDDDDLHLLLDKIEADRACKQRVLSEILESHGIFTMHPSSLFARILSIKWRFEHEDYREVYQETLTTDPTLITYLCVIDAESFYTKILDNKN